MTEKQRRATYVLARHRVWQPIEWLRPDSKELANLQHPVVLVNGAFDILHVGHMRLIYTAREHAKTLIVALDGDDKITAEKGPTRPIQNFIERASALNYMPVDYIVEISNRNDLDTLVGAVKPDLRVQGWDYKDTPSRYPEVPKIIVRRTYTPTSKLIERILEKHSNLCPNNYTKTQD